MVISVFGSLKTIRSLHELVITPRVNALKNEISFTMGLTVQVSESDVSTNLLNKLLKEVQ